jgi:hypothetical protein
MYTVKLWKSHRKFLAFFRYKKDWADLVCSVPGKHQKYIFLKIPSQESMR